METISTDAQMGWNGEVASMLTEEPPAERTIPTYHSPILL